MILRDSRGITKKRAASGWETTSYLIHCKKSRYEVQRFFGFGSGFTKDWIWFGLSDLKVGKVLLFDPTKVHQAGENAKDCHPGLPKSLNSPTGCYTQLPRIEYWAKQMRVDLLYM
jgi:hypothetical protein